MLAIRSRIKNREIDISKILRNEERKARRADKRNPHLGQLVDLCLHNGGTRALSAWIEMIVSRHVFIRHARP